jgi:hypothetical protein
MQLLLAGRNVVAAARSADKAEVFAELEPDSLPGTLFIRTGIDITNPSTLSDELLEGVTQIVSAVGPVGACWCTHLREVVFLDARHVALVPYVDVQALVRCTEAVAALLLGVSLEGFWPHAGWQDGVSGRHEQ